MGQKRKGKNTVNLHLAPAFHPTQLILNSTFTAPALRLCRCNNQDTPQTPQPIPPSFPIRTHNSSKRIIGQIRSFGFPPTSSHPHLNGARIPYVLITSKNGCPSPVSRADIMRAREGEEEDGAGIRRRI